MKPSPRFTLAACTLDAPNEFVNVAAGIKMKLPKRNCEVHRA